MKGFFTVFFLLSIAFVHAQDRVIHFERGSNKPFIVDNKAYFFKEREMIFANEEALGLLKRARGQAVLSQVVGGVGGGFLGAALAYLLLPKDGTFTAEQMDRKKTVRNVFLISGIALVGVTIPIGKSAIRKVELAVDMENGVGLTAPPSQTLRFSVGANAVGLAYNF